MMGRRIFSPVLPIPLPTTSTMTLAMQSAKPNGHDPRSNLKDVLERLLMHPDNRINPLLAHRWRQTTSGKLLALEEH